MTHIYLQKNNADKAAHYVNRLLDCQFQKKELNRSSLADAYMMMGEIYFSHSHLDQTKRSLSRLYETEPERIPSMNDVYNVVQNAFIERRHLDGAINYFKELLLNKRQTLSKQDPSLIKIQKIIRNMYLNKRDFHQALAFFQQLHDDQFRSNPAGDLVLADIYEIIGTMYSELGMPTLALEYYRHSLSIYERMGTSQNGAIKKLKNAMRKLIVSDETL
ncbi:unnamed protein product [Rotaria sp. Silwood2]|nr:unnamed protein product [Rotaria sp. Silwood2]